MSTLEFKEEILLPTLNGQAYYALFLLENWLRRLCFAAYMVRYGPQWVVQIPVEIRASTLKRVEKSKSLLYLGAETDNNLIWMTTHGELNRLLFKTEVWPVVESLTGFDKSKLTVKLQELNDIRNLLAHNRSMSAATDTILRGIVASLRLGIENFKGMILYDDDHTFILSDDDPDNLNQHFQLRMKDNDWSKFQAFLARTDYFYEFVCLPSEPWEKYVSAVRILEVYRSVLGNIVAFTVNKALDAFSVLLPRNIDAGEARTVCDVFTRERNVWTSKSFENQDPKFICNPRIWFCENRRPREE